MKERPILFSGPMVRAILDGRKTQTRRIIKIGHNATFGASSPKFHLHDWTRATVRTNMLKAVIGTGIEKCLHVPFCHRDDGWCEDQNDDTWDRVYPRWRNGDLLWVRETWGIFETLWTDYGWEQQGLIEFSTKRSKEDLVFIGVNVIHRLVYAADGYEREVGYEPGFKPSIHMPRWASRIDLKIVSVRAERLQDISEEDAYAEGFTKLPSGHFEPMSARSAFAWFWKDINGRESWDANPWVWRIEFERVKP